MQLVVGAIDEHIPVEVETDASEFGIPATLNENGCPVRSSPAPCKVLRLGMHLSRRRLMALLKQFATGSITLRESTSS